MVKLKIKIKMPQDGTIAKTDGMEGSIAQAGSPIAYAYNLDDLYVQLISMKMI